MHSLEVEKLVYARTGIELDEMVAEQKYLSDRNYSKSGWHYRRYGDCQNATKYYELINSLIELNKAEVIMDETKHDKNDHSLRYERESIHLINGEFYHAKGRTNRDGKNLDIHLVIYS